MKITGKAHARAGLIGNPSDGFNGKTISFIIKDFTAEATCEESERLEVIPGSRDTVDFGSLDELARDVDLHGYYGGLRLQKAALKRFHTYCSSNGISLPDRNCRLSYRTDIPMQVGLAGSSAIVTATMKALLEFYGVEIPKPLLPGVVLEVETKELGIPAGYQDRVIQVYEGLVYMDFDAGFMQEHGHGCFEELPTDNLPPLYVAYLEDLSEGTEVFHNDIRARWERGDHDVVAAMQQFSQYAEDARTAIRHQEWHWLSRLLDSNFDLRASLYRLSDRNHQLVETARQLGCSSKFAGSGGAVVGILPAPEVFPELQAAYTRIGAKAIRPCLT